MLISTSGVDTYSFAQLPASSCRTTLCASNGRPPKSWAQTLGTLYARGMLCITLAADVAAGSCLLVCNQQGTPYTPQATRNNSPVSINQRRTPLCPHTLGCVHGGREVCNSQHDNNQGQLVSTQALYQTALIRNRRYPNVCALTTFPDTKIPACPILAASQLCSTLNPNTSHLQTPAHPPAHTHTHTHPRINTPETCTHLGKAQTHTAPALQAASCLGTNLLHATQPACADTLLPTVAATGQHLAVALKPSSTAVPACIQPNDAGLTGPVQNLQTVVCCCRITYRATR